LLPIDIAVTPDDNPDTETGENDCVVDPLPNWPLSFAPQHLAAPSNTTQVEFPPAEIELWIYELLELDDVSFESALAAFVVSPKIPNRAAATAIPTSFDFLESFVFCENSDMKRPFKEWKLGWLSAGPHRMVRHYSE
jgi:hypothetical protein